MTWDKNNKKDKYHSSPDELIPLRRAAEISGLTQEHLAHLIREGKLWGDKIGSPVWFTTEEAVRAYLAQERKPGPKPKQGN